MTIFEAVAQAEKEQSRCVVILDKDNREQRRVYLADGKLWVSAGNPACLEPFTPTISDILHAGWAAADDPPLGP